MWVHVLEIPSKIQLEISGEILEVPRSEKKPGVDASLKIAILQPEIVEVEYCAIIFEYRYQKYRQK
jgi:hypothetical protein